MLVEEVAVIFIEGSTLLPNVELLFVRTPTVGLLTVLTFPTWSLLYGTVVPIPSDPSAVKEDVAVSPK